MRSKNWITPISFFCFVLVGAVLLSSAPGPSFTTRDKAYYADPNLVNFVRPGLIVKIQSASVADDGTIKARVKVTDLMGLGLDREGIVTPGLVSMSFIAAHIPRNATQYVAYTTRVQTSTITNSSAVQAGSDTGGRWVKVADGEYEYTFGRKAPADFPKDATHSIGVYSSRNLDEFDLGRQYDDDVFNFVPNGAKVTEVRDVVKTTSCNSCHDPLALHGGSRRSVELCVMCHSPQTTDPDTGNTVDMPVMIHKIHMGADLPSVQAGKPYKIIGNQGSVHDYSTVVIPSDARNCAACHEPGGTQKTNIFKPSRAACGACHDNVNFATGENHVDLPQVSDNQCSTCHTPQGELDFDASITGAHMIPRKSAMLPGTVFEVTKVDDGSAGKRPTVTFSVKDKAGNPIKPSDMTRLALVLAGPTSDYASYVSEDVRNAQGENGIYHWTFAQTIPADARGSMSVGIEGYRNITLLEGTKKQTVVRDAGVNKVLTFPVDGSRVEPRRQIVALEKCNACHTSLSLHGDNRNRIEMCVLCHNPNMTDAAVRPAAEMPAQTIDFRTMIHKIHSGEALNESYVIYGRGSTKYEFNEVRYPGDRRNCSACHVNSSEQLPMKENLIPVNNPRGRMKTLQPTTAACTACHTNVQVLSHAMANTTSMGESCSTCHGPSSEFSVNRVHAR